MQSKCPPRCTISLAHRLRCPPDHPQSSQPSWQPPLTQPGLPDIDQHVGVGAVPDRQVIVVAPVVVLNGLFLRAPRHHIIIEFTPLWAEGNQAASVTGHAEARDPPKSHCSHQQQPPSRSTCDLLQPPASGQTCQGKPPEGAASASLELRGFVANPRKRKGQAWGHHSKSGETSRKQGLREMFTPPRSCVWSIEVDRPIKSGLWAS